MNRYLVGLVGVATALPMALAAAVAWSSQDNSAEFDGLVSSGSGETTEPLTRDTFTAQPEGHSLLLGRKAGGGSMEYILVPPSPK